jgi:hypothetical protein
MMSREVVDLDGQLLEHSYLAVGRQDLPARDVRSRTAAEALDRPARHAETGNA